MNQNSTSEQLVDFFSHYTTLNYKKGERILRENETPAGVYYIKSGIVRTYLISEEGTELTLMLQPTGMLFPLRWVMNDLPNIHNFQAMNETTLWRAPKSAFQELIKGNYNLVNHINQQLINDWSSLAYRLQHLVFGNATTKVASIVLTAAKQFGNRDEKNDRVDVIIPLTHQQIADSAGVTRETASLEMKKMKERGIITYKGKCLMVNDLKLLESIAYI